MLGCQLLDPRACVPEVVSALGDRLLESFYDLRHQVVQEHLAAMAAANEPIDLISFQQRLKDRNLLAQVGGISYLSQLQDAVPSAANLSYYLEIVREKYTLRKVISVCTDAVGKLYDHEGDADSLVDEVEREVLAVRAGRPLAKDMKSLAHSVAEYMEARFAMQGQLGGMSTGLPALDRLCDGLRPKKYVVVAGPSSAGKTSLVLQMVEHVCVDSRHPTAVFTQEMSAESLTQRIAFSRSRVALQDVRDGRLTAEDFQRVVVAMPSISSAPLYIDDQPGMSIHVAFARLRMLVQRHGVRLAVFDYIQKFSDPEKARRGNREQEVASVSATLFRMAQEFGIPVVGLSQLNEDGQARESKAIFNDSDQFWKLRHVEQDPVKRKGQDTLEIDLDADKDRDGPTGIVPLVFFPRFTRFEARAVNQEERQ